MLTTSPDVLRIIDLALDEDVGRGDWTTLATTPEGLAGAGRIVAKESCVVAGLPVLDVVWARLRSSVTIRAEVTEGARVDAGTVVARLDGPYRDLLTGERVALNLLQRATGIATATSAFAEAVAGTGTRIADTRKTAPGLRALDKYAVRVGGGANHRTALDGGVLIKENHVAAAGSIAESVRRARALAPMTLRVEVETRDLDEVDQALAAGADIIMLDNMTLAEMRTAVERIAGRAVVEASGNMSLDRVGDVARTGVDVISVGALTHSVRAADLSMLIEPKRTQGS